MNTLAVKRVLGRVGKFTRGRETRRVVLLYHAVGSGPDACPTEQFAKQISWLDANAEVLPLEELLAGRGKAKLQVAITFDDGYASVAHEAAPIMDRYGITGTVYLTAACIGEAESTRRHSDPAQGHLSGEKFMLWSEARALQDAYWEIGSHGLDHVDMTGQDDEKLSHQIDSARMLIENRLGATCRAFAYPWGRNNARSQAAVAQAGHDHAAGTIHGPVRPGADMLSFRRIDIRREYEVEDLRRVVHGDWDYLGYLQLWRMRRSTRD